MSRQVEPLADEDDAFGRLLLDHLAGRAGDAFLDRDDGWSGPALGPEWFFAEPNAWAGPEQLPTIAEIRAPELWISRVQRAVA